MKYKFELSCGCCDKYFKNGDEVIYHTEIDKAFCNDKCLQEFDKEFQKIVEVELEEEGDEAS